MSKQFSVYPAEEQYDRWSARAEELDMSMSEFTKSMTEAGMKKFERTVEPDETKADLRRQRNDLRDELHRTRERVGELERQLTVSERETIIEYVSENPGATYQDIVQHVLNSANGRVTKLLDRMEGTELEMDEEGRFYRLED